jgi:hypothetical protein
MTSATGSLPARIKALESRIGWSGRVLIVSVDWSGRSLPGSVVRVRDNVLRLVVPLDHAADPMAGLTESQRGAIGPDDRVISLVFNSRAALGPAAAAAEHRRATWQTDRANPLDDGVT